MNFIKHIRINGVYKHYKGNYYQVLNIAKHTETNELLVIYKKLSMVSFTNEKLWARPKKMFLEKVDIDGTKVDRFKLVDCW